MRIAFRCDARPSSGLGHLMRCRALAGALEARGRLTYFAPMDKEQPANCDAIVVDSYDVNTADLARWAEIAPVCVIDDLADRELSPAALVINQNFGAQQLAYRSGNAALLLGPQFAMLRPQFNAMRVDVRRKFLESDGRVLVTLGGGPVQHQLRQVLAELARVKRPLEITVLGLEDADTGTAAHRVRSLPHVDDPWTLMANADLCISAGGVSTLELACLGTPAIVVTLAPNQEPAAAFLDATHAAVAAGPLEGALPTLSDRVEQLLADPAARALLSANAARCVDGEGVERVASQIELIARTKRSRS